MPLNPTLDELSSQQPWLPPAASNFNKQLSGMAGNVGRSALDAVKNVNDLIGAAMSAPPGMTGSDLEQQARIAAKLGLDVTMGGLGLGGAGLAEENALGIMGGGRGFREMAERGGSTDPLFYQKLAEKLYNRPGFDRLQILKGTGWYKERPTGTWNKEIFDAPSSLNYHEIPFHDNYFETKTTVGKVLNHDDLYSVYPHLKDLPLFFRNYPQAARMGRQGAFGHPTQQYPHGGIIINNPHLKTPFDIRSTLLHELQHATDVYEGRTMRPTPNLPFRDYTRLSEEARARNTQYRADFLPEELENAPPWETMKRMQYPLKELDVRP